MGWIRTNDGYPIDLQSTALDRSATTSYKKKNRWMGLSPVPVGHSNPYHQPILFIKLRFSLTTTTPLSIDLLCFYYYDVSLRKNKFILYVTSNLLKQIITSVQIL